MSIKRFAAGGLLKCALAMTAGGFARKRASIHVIKLGGCKGTNVFNGAHCRTPCRRTIPPADIQTRLAVAPSAITPPMSFALGRGVALARRPPEQGMIPRGPSLPPAGCSADLTAESTSQGRPLHRTAALVVSASKTARMMSADLLWNTSRPRRRCSSQARAKTLLPPWSLRQGQWLSFTQAYTALEGRLRRWPA